MSVISQISNSIGYASLDATVKYGTINGTSQSCGLRMAKIINKAGAVVAANVASAEAAFRSSANNLISNTSCPGFGICGDLIDAADDDVWPITAISVSSLMCHPVLLVLFQRLQATQITTMVLNDHHFAAQMH